MTRTLLFCAIGTALCAGPAVAFDKADYKQTVGETIMAIQSGDVDVDTLIAKQMHLMDLGVGALRDYATAHPDSAKLLNFVADQAPSMPDMSLDQIEAQWHEGGALDTIGIKLHDLDHFGEEVSLMDTVVHPATAVIALRRFKTDGNEDHLDQVIDELSEVVEHLGHLE